MLVAEDTEREAEEPVKRCLKRGWRSNLNLYENLKAFTYSMENPAFDQVDEDIQVLARGKLSSVERLGKTKEILKVFMLFQKATGSTICYCLGYGLIIQRLLALYTEERSFWMFVSVLKHLSKWISVDRSVLLNRDSQHDHELPEQPLSIQQHTPVHRDPL